MTDHICFRGVQRLEVATKENVEEVGKGSGSTYGLSQRHEERELDTLWCSLRTVIGQT